MYISANWENKEQRAQKAQKHAETCASEYASQIQESVQNTIVYSPDHHFVKRQTPEYDQMLLTVEDADSVTAIFQEIQNNGKIAVLNFASYKNPGGMFLQGSRAQEECLCHESFLYNVLSANSDYYQWNSLHKNRAMYMNRALYSPKITFERYGNTAVCDVITCAAPNYSAAKKYQRVTLKENEAVLKNRIRFVLDIAEENSVDILILGAFGCGVFEQNPKTVASIFKEELETAAKYHFKKVVFAVPDGNNNYSEFKKIFTSK